MTSYSSRTAGCPVASHSPWPVPRSWASSNRWCVCTASTLRSRAVIRTPNPPARVAIALRLRESLDEVERGLRDLLPAVVDGQRVAAVRHLHDLGDARVARLPLVGRV